MSSPSRFSTGQLAGHERKGRMMAMAPDALVGEYRIVEFVGQDDRGALYVALKEPPNLLFWLLELDRPIRQPHYKSGQTFFEWQGKHYFALSMAGTTAATLAQLVYTVDWAFIGSRWIAVAQQMGRLHHRGELYQSESPFALEDIVFDKEGQASLAKIHRESGKFMLFTAPEMAEGHPTPASDVYALGASLSTLLGVPPPGVAAPPLQKRNKPAPALAAVLNRATAQEPKARYLDASEFAQALATAILQAERSQSAAQGRSKSYLLLALLLLLVLMVGSSLAFWRRSAEGPDHEVVYAATPTSDGQDFPSFGLEVSNSSDVLISWDIGQEIEAKPTDPISFTVSVNGQAISDVKQKSRAKGQYLLSFSTPLRDDDQTLFKVSVSVGDEVLTKTIYFYNDDYDPKTVTGDNNDPLPPPTTTTEVITSSQAASGMAVRPTQAILEIEQEKISDEEQIQAPVVGLSEPDSSALQVATKEYPQLSIYFTLLNEAGEAVRLQEGVEIELWQDGAQVKEVSLTEVNLDTDPLTTALVVDVSSSMAGEPIAAARQAASEFVNQLRVNDSVCVYTFATKINKAQACTTDHKKVISVINQLEPVDDTALYDVLIRVSEEQQRLPGRQAIVVLSDGSDTVSQATLDMALAHVQQSNIPLYIIGLISEQFNGALLGGLAEATTGVYLETPSATDLQALYTRTQDQLSNQYRLNFTSLYPNRQSGMLTIRFISGQEVVSTTREFFVQQQERRPKQ